jgi:hypothetical protein
MTEGEKSLDQLIQLPMSIYYNWDITNREKDNRHDLIATPTRLRPTSWVCYHGGQEEHFFRECLRGDSMGDSPAPNQDPALSAKVTTRGLSASITRWKARCHLLWIGRSWAPVHTPLLGIDVEEPHGSHYDKTTTTTKKIIFRLDTRTHFSVLPYSPGPQSNDKSYHSGHIWQAPRALFYPASGLLFGKPPLLSLFPHST